MLIGGLQKFSLIDYPGKISAVVFLIGCNFRCGFCHNPELVNPQLIKKQPKISPEEILEFLLFRRGKLEGVCITGAEPMIQKDLPNFVSKIKKMGFSIKADTNATNPKMVKKLIHEKLVDYFAVDVKNSPQKYKKTVRAEVKLEDIEESLKLIAASSVLLELRTTVVPGLIETQDFVRIKSWLEELDILDRISLYAIQQFRSIKTLNKDFRNIKPYSENQLKEMARVFTNSVKTEIRGI